MLLSPLSNVVIRIPFYNQWLYRHMGGIHGIHTKFKMKSLFGFGLRFLNRDQQNHYLRVCTTAKLICSLGAVCWLGKTLLNGD